MLVGTPIAIVSIQTIVEKVPIVTYDRASGILPSQNSLQPLGSDHGLRFSAFKILGITDSLIGHEDGLFEGAHAKLGRPYFPLEAVFMIWPLVVFLSSRLRPKSLPLAKPPSKPHLPRQLPPQIKLHLPPELLSMVKIDFHFKFWPLNKSLPLTPFHTLVWLQSLLLLAHPILFVTLLIKC
jgi:hypothetical protein